MTERTLTTEEELAFLHGKIDGLTSSVAVMMKVIVPDTTDRQRLMQALHDAHNQILLGLDNTRYEMHRLGVKNVAEHLGALLLKP